MTYRELLEALQSLSTAELEAEVTTCRPGRVEWVKVDGKLKETWGADQFEKVSCLGWRDDAEPGAPFLIYPR
jgi:hypothetical protein